MKRPMHWAAAGAALASLALVAATLAPIAHADSPHHGGRGSQSQGSYLVNEMSKMAGWSNIIGKLESTVQQQGHEISQLQSELQQQQTELNAVLTKLGMSGSGYGQTSLSGTVTAVTEPSDGNPGSITVQPSGASAQTLSVAADVQVTGPSGNQEDFSQVAVGDSVQLTLVGDVVVALTDAGPTVTSSTLQGSVTAFTAPYGGTNGSLSVLPSGSSSAESFVVPSNVSLTSASGQAVNFSNLTNGTDVSVTAENGTAMAIEILNLSQTSVLGTVMAFSAPSGSSAGVLTLLQSGTSTATNYTIAANTPVFQGTTPSNFSAVTMNTPVELTLQNGTVMEIDILQ